MAGKMNNCDMIKGNELDVGKLILRFRLKEVINNYVLHCTWIEIIAHISATRCLTEMGLDESVAF